MLKLWFSFSFLFLLLFVSGCSKDITKTAKKLIGKQEITDEEFAEIKNTEGLQACSQGDYANAAKFFKLCVERDENLNITQILGVVITGLGVIVMR